MTATDSDGSSSGAVTRVLKIINEKGLHARASAKFVGVVEKFRDNTSIKVSKGDETVSGDSIMGLMMLGAGIGSSITVSATGVQAREAVDALDALVSSRFGEEEERSVKRPCRLGARRDCKARPRQITPAHVPAPP